MGRSSAPDQTLIWLRPHGLSSIPEQNPRARREVSGLAAGEGRQRPADGAPRRDADHPLFRRDRRL